MKIGCHKMYECKTWSSIKMEFVRIFECMCLILVINILYVLTINMFYSLAV